MKFISQMRALLKCLTDAEGFQVPSYGCSSCPFSRPSAGGGDINPSDLDEGYYDCSLLEGVDDKDSERIWGEEPRCDAGDWAGAVQREVEALEAKYDALDEEHLKIQRLLKSACWLVWSNEHAAWWGPDRGGYYTDISAAGRYTYEEAMSCCEQRSKSGDLPPEMIQPSPEFHQALAILSKTAAAASVEAARGGKPPVQFRGFA